MIAPGQITVTRHDGGRYWLHIDAAGADPSINLVLAGDTATYLRDLLTRLLPEPAPPAPAGEVDLWASTTGAPMRLVTVLGQLFLVHDTARTQHRSVSMAPAHLVTDLSAGDARALRDALVAQLGPGGFSSPLVQAPDTATLYGKVLWQAQHLVGAFRLARDGDQLTLFTDLRDGDQYAMVATYPDVAATAALVDALLTYLGEVAP